MFSWHPRWACFEEFLVPGQCCLSSPLCVQRAGFVEGEQMSSSHPWQFLTWVSCRSPMVTADSSLEWKRGFKPFPHKMAASLQGITPPAPVRRLWTFEYFHFIQYVKETLIAVLVCIIWTCISASGTGLDGFHLFAAMFTMKIMNCVEIGSCTETMSLLLWL